MPQIRADTQQLSRLADVYVNASRIYGTPWRTPYPQPHPHDQQSNVDAALLASVGFGNTGADVFERSGPYLVRGLADAVPTNQLLDEYSPEIYCTIRNFHDAVPKIAASFGGNGYSTVTHTELLEPPIRTYIRIICPG